MCSGICTQDSPPEYLTLDQAREVLDNRSIPHAVAGHEIVVEVAGKRVRVQPAIQDPTADLYRRTAIVYLAGETER